MTACIVCGSGRSETTFKGLRKCETCGHVFADVAVGSDELAALYQRGYFRGDEYSDYVADRAILCKNFRLRLKALEPLLDPRRHRRALEIGCAYGFFLDLLRDRFDRTLGVDVSEDAVCYAREQLGLDVIQGALPDVDLGEEKFDVVCMWDTIEHLQRPDQVVSEISKHMESGSLLAITTGDIGSLNARVKGAKWRLIHPPTHLQYFTRKTLRMLLQQYGFDIVYERYCGFFRSLDNTLYNILVLRHGREDWYGFLRESRLIRFDFYLNLRDIVYVIARRN